MERTNLVKRRLLRRIKASCEAYGLLAEGDRVLVALSGGKDSYTLLELLECLRRSAPFSFSLVAVHLDQRQPGYDGTPLVGFLEQAGYDFEILSEDTYSVVTDRLEVTATYCSLCSRLRRGILYTAAERLGCNKLALGHHRDDALETFLMNLFYSGRLQSMPAGYTTNDGKQQVIRPLIECAESDIAEYAAARGFPIIPCNLCGSQSGLKRDAMARLLEQLESGHPHLRSVMMNALANVRPTHLLDRDLHAAWATRSPDVRPDPPPPTRVIHAGAEPVVTAKRRLQVLG